jgi:hypothetical protein
MKIGLNTDKCEDMKRVTVTHGMMQRRDFVNKVMSIIV